MVSQNPSTLSLTCRTSCWNVQLQTIQDYSLEMCVIQVKVNNTLKNGKKPISS